MTNLVVSHLRLQILRPCSLDSRQLRQDSNAVDLEKASALDSDRVVRVVDESPFADEQVLVHERVVLVVYWRVVVLVELEFLVDVFEQLLYHVRVSRFGFELLRLSCELLLASSLVPRVLESLDVVSCVVVLETET